MRHRMWLLGAIVYLCATNIAWIAIDTRPPFWDMANHATWSLGVLRDFQANGISALTTLPYASPGYPPLYYAVVATAYRLLGESIDSAQLANIPAIILLALATYGTARHLLSPAASVVAAGLVNFYPFMLWISRETLIETWLTAMVALAIWTLLQTEEFSRPGWSLAFGIVCGLGMLTKWTFVIFVALPALWAARKHWRNAVKAAVVAALLASYWFIPRFSTLTNSWRQVAAAAPNEGDPTFLSLQAWIFYIRALEGSLLFLPLFLAFLVGASIAIRRWNSEWTVLGLSILGGWVGLLLLPGSDPRYATGVLPAIAVVSAAAIEKKKAAQVGLAIFLVFQHALVSFGIPWIPESVVLMRGTGGPVPYEWNLYTQSYFGLWGKPKNEDWQIDHVLQRVAMDPARPVRVGLIPDLPRFDQQAFQFAVESKQYPVAVTRQISAEEPSLLQNDYILMSAGRQTAFGSPAPHAKEINAVLLSHGDRFEVIETFHLPNEERILLYRVRKK